MLKYVYGSNTSVHWPAKRLVLIRPTHWNSVKSEACPWNLPSVSPPSNHSTLLSTSLFHVQFTHVQSCGSVGEILSSYPAWFTHASIHALFLLRCFAYFLKLILHLPRFAVDFLDDRKLCNNPGYVADLF